MHPDLVRTLIVLADLYQQQYRFDEAVSQLHRAQQMAEHLMGRESELAFEPQEKLIDVFRSSGRAAQADSVLQVCGLLAAKLFGPAHPRQVSLLRQMAKTNRINGRYDSATRLLDSAAALTITHWGDRHPALVGIALERARLQADQHQAALAETTLTTCGSLVESLYGANHPAFAEVLMMLADLSSNREDFKRTRSLAARSLASTVRFVRENAIALTEQDALRFATKIADARDKTLTACRLSTDSVLPAEVAEPLLQCKGLVFEIESERSRAALATSDSTVQALQQEIRLARYRLARLVLAETEMSTPDRQAAQVDSLVSEVDRLERARALQAGGSRQNSIRSVRLDSLTSNLRPNDGAVEYLRYVDRSKENASVDRYAALYFRKGSGVHFVDLGEASGIDSLVFSFRNKIETAVRATGIPSRADERTLRATGLHLAAAVAPFLSGSEQSLERLIISPDGPLFALSFAALPCNGDSYFVEQFQVLYASQLRSRTVSGGNDRLAGSLLAVGGPDFDARLDQPVFDTTSSFSMIADDARQQLRAVADCAVLSGQLNPLPHASREAEALVSLWKGMTRSDGRSLIGVAATEQSVRELAGRFQCLHLATHGFSLASQCIERPFDDASRRQQVHAMLRSGLCLAGANRRAADAGDLPHADDGLLTAYEIAVLDLRGTSLVVLSACESGMGQEIAGEDVYGLRRAFELAGVRTIVSSLWAVDDRRTARFMQRLYGGMAGGQSAAESLHAEQVELIHTLRRAGRSTHPALWGAFVVHSQLAD